MAKAPQATKLSIWFQLYFVAATLIGLICLVFGSSSLINTLLTSTVFQVKSQKYSMPPQPAVFDKSVYNEGELTESQRIALENWERDYQSWQDEQKNYDYEAESRKRSLAWAVALIVTGIPVFALHAPVVFRKTKEA
jgi:hypothetical protein